MLEEDVGRRCCTPSTNNLAAYAARLFVEGENHNFHFSGEQFPEN